MHSLRAQTWLILRNDFRLFWRDLRSWKMRVFSSAAMIGLLFAIIQAAAIALFLVIKSQPPLVGETIAWFFFGFLMLGAAMNHAVTVLFERADFDLLLASPVSPRAILLARLSAMIAAAAASAALFVVPLVNGAAIGLSARYLSGHLVWLLLAAIVTCAGIWTALGLVRWLGPRRARTWTQVLAAVLGALIYIAFQLQNALPPEWRETFSTTLGRVFRYPLFTLVARAGRGEVLPLLGLLVLAMAMVWFTTRLLDRLFVTGLQEAGVVRNRRTKHRKHTFVEGLLHATFRKDLRLIVRDPLLLSRVLPSVFYLVPMLFPLFRIGHGGAAGVLASFSVIVAVMLSSQLTSVAAAGEEGWDLIRLSPASTAVLRLAKIGAGMALPVALAGLVLVIVATLGRPGLALFALLTMLISSTGSCWIEVAEIRPTPRKDLIQQAASARRPMSAGRIIGGVIFLLVGTVSVALASNHLWLLACAGLGVIILTAIGCFVLMEMKDIEFESTTSQPTSDGVTSV